MCVARSDGRPRWGANEGMKERLHDVFRWLDDGFGGDIGTPTGRHRQGWF